MPTPIWRGIFLSLISYAIVAPSATAQRRPAPNEPASEVSRGAADAIRDFERHRDDAIKRNPSLTALGKHDAPAVTEVLIAELARVDGDAARAKVVDALGAIPREGVLMALAAELLRDPGSPALRRAAAKGLARQGEHGITVLDGMLRDELALGAIEKLRDRTAQRRMFDLRDASIAGLAVAEHEAAWPLLAEIVVRGRPSERMPALRGLDAAEATREVLSARLAAVGGDDLQVVARAAAQLAAQGHPKGVEAGLRVARKLGAMRQPPEAVRLEMLRALAGMLDRREVFEPFLEQISVSDPTVAEFVDELAQRPLGAPEFEAWLLRTLSGRTSELERCASIELLTHSDATQVTALLTSLLRGNEPPIVYAAARALGRRGDLTAVPDLQRLLRAPGGERRIEALFALHDLLAKDPSWESQLLELAAASRSERELRATVIDFLADLRSEAGLDLVLAEIDDRAWQLRAAAFDYCRRVRSTRSIPALIERVDEERARLREEVLDTLQSLTGRRLQTTAQWREWWSSARDGFEVLPEAESRAPRAKRERGGDTEHTVTYYEIPLISDRVAFVVDTSGSMSAKIGTDKKRTRLDEAKVQLERVVQAMPNSTRFNILFFDHAANGVFEHVAVADKAGRESAMQAIARAKPGGGTDVFEALELAFRDPEVDTIYLLSDGYPSAGTIQDADALADEVARWNRTRQIRIHGIALGTDSGLLRRLAAESGGKYAHFR